MEVLSKHSKDGVATKLRWFLVVDWTRRSAAAAAQASTKKMSQRTGQWRGPASLFQDSRLVPSHACSPKLKSRREERGWKAVRRWLSREASFKLLESWDCPDGVAAALGLGPFHSFRRAVSQQHSLGGAQAAKGPNLHLFVVARAWRGRHISSRRPTPFRSPAGIHLASPGPTTFDSTLEPLSASQKGSCQLCREHGPVSSDSRRTPLWGSLDSTAVPCMRPSRASMPLESTM